MIVLTVKHLIMLTTVIGGSMYLKSPIIFLALLLLSASTTAAAAVAACNQTCGGWKLPFPFGFSSACEIQLNCSSNSTVISTDFPVLSITSDTILVNLPARCSLPVEALGHLFTRNYAPNSRNAVLLQNCSGGYSPCVIPTTAVESSFELNGCGPKNDSLSCYSEPENRTLFLDYEILRKRGCRSLFSTVSYEFFEKNSSTNFDVGVVRLGWWVLGNCSCSKHARCYGVLTPVAGNPPAHRCQCMEGFVGDGYIAGGGCRKGSGEGHSDGQKIVIIGVSLGISVLVILSFIVYYYMKHSRLHSLDQESNQNVERFLLNYGSLAPKRYSYYDIKKMTKSFKEKLGQGGYGIVYKGNLSDGEHVAVKVLTEIHENAEDFINEVTSISRTSHVNIVNLLGFCYDRHRRALVYEYMPNKSLEKFISKHGSEDHECSLELDKLYEIALGVARGLDYLHRGCNTSIVHFDIKPQNILLDEDFCPKISDFGLAKLFKQKQSKLSVLGARGTIGYIAPEVFSRNFGPVSHKSDVYSYGMMLLEMGEARKMVETEPIQSSDNYFPEKIYERAIIKNRELADIETEEIEETVRKMLMVGIWCIQTAPSERPSMSKVVEMLEGSVQSIQIPPKPVFPSLKLSGSAQFSSSVNFDTRNPRLATG